jgi:anti-sigma factor RsiW
MLIVTHVDHPSHESLAYLLEGLLGALERSRVERHVAACERCSTDLLHMVTPDGAPGRNRARSAPSGVLARARSLLLNRSSRRERIQHLIGTLRFDSARMKPAFGMRATASNGPRQLVFDAGVFEIELRATQVSTGWGVSGQVLGPTDATSGHVQIVGTKTIARARLSEFLEFNLTPVPAGTYLLEVQVGTDTHLAVNSLELGP